MIWRRMYTLSFFFFFNDTATTEIYTLSLHDALPISKSGKWQGLNRFFDLAVLSGWVGVAGASPCAAGTDELLQSRDRKSTRLNSSHSQISYAVFCLKKKKKITTN